MFEETIIELLKGTFICRTGNPELFDYLNHDTNKSQIDGYLMQIGRRLHITKNGHAYYAVYKTLRPENRAAISKLFQEIKNEIRPVLKFLNLVIQAEHEEIYVSPNHILYFSELLNEINENANLEEILRDFPNLGKEFAANDASLHALLDRVMNYLVHKDYLIKEQNGDCYRVTGKIDYYYEVVDFIMENETPIQNAQEFDPNEMEKDMGSSITERLI